MKLALVAVSLIALPAAANDMALARATASESLCWLVSNARDANTRSASYYALRERGEYCGSDGILKRSKPEAPQQITPATGPQDELVKTQIEMSRRQQELAEAQERRLRIESAARLLTQTKPAPYISPSNTQTYFMNGRMVICNTYGAVTNCF